MRENEKDKWESIRQIWEIITRLRGESGCPWDRKQTPVSVQTYLIEEAHEAAAAVRAGQTEDVAEELGDLLFMVLFMTYLFEEKGLFGLEDVGRLICEKMIRRHPHVFANWRVHSSEEVKDNWEKIKAYEKNSSGKSSETVPGSLPALMRAYRIIARRSRKTDEGQEESVSPAEDFEKKSRELAQRLNNDEIISSEIFGELLFDLVDMARIKGYQAEFCLHQYLDNHFHPQS